MTTTYRPSFFSATDEEALRLADEFPFASLVSIAEGGAPFVNHLPLLLERRSGGANVLIGHMARRNPQWTHFKSGARALAVFQGPNAYISPTWYGSGRDVPTWNYVVSHFSGAVRIIEDFAGLTSILSKLSERFEKDLENPWAFELPEDLRAAGQLEGAIVGFEITVEKIEGKFKLSQQRPLVDQQGVLAGLANRGDEGSHRIREMMIKLTDGARAER